MEMFYDSYCIKGNRNEKYWVQLLQICNEKSMQDIEINQNLISTKKSEVFSMIFLLFFGECEMVVNWINEERFLPRNTR